MKGFQKEMGLPSEVKVHDCSVAFFLFLVLIARNLARSLGVPRTGINYSK